jgi:glycosyltransferase involved in cell wall biosynthesis
MAEAQRTEKVLAVCVAVPTCDRPDTLDLLLKSLAGQHRPRDCRVTFLVVDNSRGEGAGAVVEANREAFGQDRLELIAESRLGIPFARNRALDHALEQEADLLLFLDDDEAADPFWLSALVAKYRGGNADLIGGPVFARQPAGGLTAWQTYLMRGTERWYRARQARNEHRVRKGQEHRVISVTNNWLLDLAFQRRTGLRFDERLRIGGGSDVHFFHAAVRLGAKTAWCLDARVYEFIVPARLSARYIAFRAQQQAISHFERHRGDGSPVRRLWQIVAAPPILLLGIGRIVLAPVLGPYSLVDGLRLCGRASGKVLSVLGASSQLYKYGTCGATPPYDTFGRDRWPGCEILAEPGPINADARPAFPE